MRTARKSQPQLPTVRTRETREAGRGGWWTCKKTDTAATHIHWNTRVSCCVLRAAHYPLCSCRGVSCGLCRVRLCSIFRVWGLSVHSVSEKRTGEKSPPLAPIPEGETVCTSLALFLCQPPRASIARSPEQGSLPSDHHEPTSSLVTLWVRKTTPELSASLGPQSLGWLHSKTPWHSLCQLECLCLFAFRRCSHGFPRRNSVHP